MRKIIRDDLTNVIQEDRYEFVKDKQEHLDMLIQKIDEELLELKESDYTDVDEYADVIEVIVGIAKLKGIPEHCIDTARLIKNADKGMFNNGVILHD